MSCINFDTLLTCAKLSHIAYNDYDTTLSASCIAPVALLDRKCWLFMDEKQGTLFVVFRGSDSVADLINNLNFIPKNYKQYGKIHGGYYHYYSAVRKQILNYISIHKERIKTVLACGHSLGGACAVLASMDIVEEHPSVNVSCVTFGTPPMADEHFVEAQVTRVPNSYRVINAEDWAPKLPIPGLCHVGKPILLCSNSNDDHGRASSCPKHKTPGAILNSHGMHRYVTCLHQTQRKPRYQWTPLCQLRVAKKNMVSTIKRLPRDAMQIPKMI